MMDNFARLLGYFVMGGCVLFCVSIAAAAAMDAIWSQIKLGRDLNWVRRAIEHYKTIEPMPKETHENES